MKRGIALFWVLWMLVASIAAQQPIVTHTLANGMRVMMCEDHQQPSIYGAILVHVGGKNDPADNTGMAHYLEHLMFKGTDRIGTTNWLEEEKLLKQIDELYDELHGAQDEAQRLVLLEQLNNVSAKAAHFAIPNEVDAILGKMGGTGVNAFTNNDVTCYHNMFPSNQLEKWLIVYTERFRRPVFRLFQSELEAVYEEFNMYADDPMSVFFEDAIAAAYGDHPYGRPVIGYQEHLKNPQTSAMERFFVNYYHPQNMTLILVGDFKAKDIIPLLETTVGQLRNEYADEFLIEDKMQKEPLLKTRINKEILPFKGNQVVNVAETPVKMGIIGYQTTGGEAKEAFYLDILSNILNNSSGTGLLDQLVKQNDLLEVEAFNYPMLEHGLFALLYVPKIVGQSHEEAESLILKAIEQLRKGDYSDALFEAVKMTYLRTYIEQMESLEDKFNTVLDLAMNNLDPKVFAEREKMIRELTKDQLTDIARQYLGDNRLSFRSSIGRKDIKRLNKPTWEPIASDNSEAVSEFAQKIEVMPVPEIKPQIIDMKQDVHMASITPSCRLYYTKNPYNNIFTIEIIYPYGTLTNPMLPIALDYFMYQGTATMESADFYTALQQLGASMKTWHTDQETYITISGFEETIDKVLELCHEKWTRPGNEEIYLQNIVNQRISEAQFNKSDAETWGRALYYYALYGQNSPYLTRPSVKAIKKMTGSELLSIIEEMKKTAAKVTYVGNIPENAITSLIQKIFKFEEKAKQPKVLVREQVKHTEAKVYLASNPKFVQSNIYFLINGNTLPISMLPQRAIYNEYMGGSMAGVIFQEIRELRSLGYSAYGKYVYDERTKAPGWMLGFLGTQADKTNEGIEAMSELLLEFPKHEEKFEMAKTSTLRQKESHYVSFRKLPDHVRILREMGYEKDPRIDMIRKIPYLTMNDVQTFYQRNIENRPLIITIAGDQKRFDLKALKKSGAIIKLKYKDFIVD